MKVDSFIHMAQQQLNSQKNGESQKEQAANDFEEIFARHLVKEMTKGSFGMSKEGGVMSNANSMYREHITNALAKELADQRKLGMADLVTKYWNQRVNSSEENS